MTNRPDACLSLEHLLAHADWAKRLARGLVADADEAEDVVQEAWISAVRQPSYERALPDPALTVELNAEISRILPDCPDCRADCRGRACLVTGPKPEEVWRRRLEHDRDFRLRLLSMAPTKLGFFYSLRTPAALAARRWLRTLTDGFEASPAVAACRSSHSVESGELVVMFSVPAAGEPNVDGQVGRVHVRAGGDLAGSPFADCMETEARRTIRDVTPPDDTAAASLAARFRLPARP